MISGRQQHQPGAHAHVRKPNWTFVDYFWFILKNIIGWVLIITSGPLGVMVPGPGGLPLFIIGFALITFPGKRRLTARVLRGIPIHEQTRAYRLTLLLIALLVPAGAISFMLGYWWPRMEDVNVTGQTVALVAIYLAAAILIWEFGRRGTHLINAVLRVVARVRRRVRPWLHQRGLHLLPPRRRYRLLHPGEDEAPDEGILEIHERHRERLRAAWRSASPWVFRAVRVLFVFAVFAWMLRPVVKRWHEPMIRQTILATQWWQFAVAALMFSVFLFVFRAMAWRYIIAGLGHRLPVAASVRIWSFSELARYVPGVIWQVLGRVYLARPYGISGAVSSASQLLELSIFMLANIIVGLGCILAAGIRHIPADQRTWIYLAIGFVPLLLLLLHPTIFYGLLNRVMRRIRKPEITQKLPKRALVAVLAWTIFGLLWQSLAIWVLMNGTLHLPLGKWYVLAGAYCLAWTVGFSVGFLSPGGMGVREAVFITTMQFLLPQEWVQRNLSFSSADFRVFLGFLGVLLRLWAIAGELTMAGISFLADYRGAMNRPDAPGRCLNVPPVSSPAEPNSQ